MTNKVKEKEATKLFLEHYNSLRSTSYEIDEEHLNNRPEEEFPDILLKTEGRQVKGLQIEVRGIHLAKAEIESQKKIMKAIKNGLQTESVNKIIIKVFGFRNPDKKGREAFVRELLSLTQNQSVFPASILSGDPKKCKYPSLKKYSREISIEKYKRNKIMLFHDAIFLNGPSLIGNGIKEKESHYSNKEKEKTILLLHDETFAGDKEDVELYVNENSGVPSGFKEIWWLDMATGDIQQIR